RASIRRACGDPRGAEGHVAKKHEPPLDRPPFPPLSWDGYCWRAEFVSPAWCCYQGGGGKVQLVVRASEEGPTAAQGAVVRYLLDHDKPLADVTLDYLMRETPWWDALDYEDEIETLSQLRDRIHLEFIFVHAVVRDGAGYMGFGFSCDWEREHGLGVLLHRERVVALGGEDVAFAEWIVSDDAEQGASS